MQDNPREFLFSMFLLVQVVSCAVAQSDDVIELEEQAFQAAVERVQDSVVKIETFAGIENSATGMAPTTGVVVSKDGFIVSSAFNFLSKPESILVTLADRTRLSATIVSRDHSRQLVLLKVEPKSELLVPQAIERKRMMAGQWSIALGRTYEQGPVNVSIGILSATNRIWGKAIQTDAKISPANYGGPLIDIHGNVFGILVPMSPEGRSVTAGAEWYDSGIGFAVPLEDVFEVLDVLKRGEDLHAGVMGISLKGNELYATAPEIAIVRFNSPARAAGLKKGDVILRINGRATVRQTQLKHILGTMYADETIELVVRRDEEEKTFRLTLTDKLVPYDRPFLGIAPRRDVDACLVGAVIPDSPAEKAGLESGDKVLLVDDHPIQSVDGLRDKLAESAPQQSVALTIQRQGEQLSLEAELTSVPDSIPVADSPSVALEAPFDGERPETGFVSITIPEDPGKCFALIPENYDPRIACGLLVWVPPAGKYKEDDFAARFAKIADEQNMIVISPVSKGNRRWMAIEAEFIRKTIDKVINTYAVDRNRVAVGGEKNGGTMALLTSFQNREIVRGICVHDAPFPRTVSALENDPANRLAFYLIASNASDEMEKMQNMQKALHELNFPVKTGSLDGKPIGEDDIQEIAIWIDTLDVI